MKYTFKLVSSLEKQFFSGPDHMREHTQGSMLKNEIYSFQLIGKIDATEDEPQKMNCKVQIESSLAPYIHLYSVGYVPVMVPAYPFTKCDDYLSRAPGLYPDPLYPLHGDSFELINGQGRSLWISVDPQSAVWGQCPIIIKIYDDQNNFVSQTRFDLTIINAELPKLDIHNTGWFHGDCISVLHNVPLQSDEYFSLVGKYLDVYTHFGHNTVLTPVFTPPLDMDIGGDRPTNQLVQVTVNCGVYSFDFSLLKKWVRLCIQHGIEYFEISHLYSQWGAKYPPKVMATVDGKYKKIFGWEQEALGEEYSTFLEAFLPALVNFLKEEGIMGKCLFHVSDEPLKDHGAQYSAAKKKLTKYIDEKQFIDALGEYSLYENGVVRRPVVSNDHIHTFMEHGASDLWTYYCCCQSERVSNRFIAMPSHRNRVLGAQIYKNQIKGFLQWGFNFWFGVRSRKVIDPYRNTDADQGFPSGDAFLVYPINEYGEIVCSLRLYVFNEGMQDYRAMKLLETLSCREEVEDLLSNIHGFDRYPRNSEYYLALRESINVRISKLMP